MQPPAEVVHWLFGLGFLVLGLCLLGEALAGPEAWRAQPWRAYLWPGFAFAMGLLMWPVMVLFVNSTIHLLAHGSWAQAMMAAGAAELGLARGKLRSRWWTLAVVAAFLVSGAALLVHEANPWLYSRSAFLHHALGWLLVGGALVPLARIARPSSGLVKGAFALTFVAAGVLLFAHRDLAPIFGHISDPAYAQVRP